MPYDVTESFKRLIRKEGIHNAIEFLSGDLAEPLTKKLQSANILIKKGHGQEGLEPNITLLKEYATSTMY